MRKLNVKAVTQAWALRASLPVLRVLTLLLGQAHHPDLWGWQPLNPHSGFAALMRDTFPPVFFFFFLSKRMFSFWAVTLFKHVCPVQTVQTQLWCFCHSKATLADTSCTVRRRRSRRRTERWTDMETKRKLLATELRDSKTFLSVFQNLLLSGCGDPLSLCPGLTGESLFTACVFMCVRRCVFWCAFRVCISELSLDHECVTLSFYS